MWVLCCKNRADYSIEQQRQQDIISIGQCTIVQTLNGRTVQKIPSDKSGIYSTRAVKIEAQVYRHLDRYKRIARCLQGSENYTDLRYEVNGDLGTYLRNHCPSDHVRHQIAQQAIEVVIFIHKVARLSDFGGSSLQGSDALVMENTTHFLPRDEDAPNTVQSDILPSDQLSTSYWSATDPTRGWKTKK
ncbi:hypothetical protein BDV35DRAFT_386889 [Aspergillus flavus]|uniref:Protein kinase domain-containing protein n=1 Tax=Aspergillus flavus TaxID=5059 RepID=A0A5N6HE82_ASPFL|nr:hypothetical protein BDV35DRAFT_386889 [Aspergillus flavus]